MRVGSLVVSVLPGTSAAVGARLAAMPHVEIAHQTADGFAIVIEADSAKTQEKHHRAIEAWPEVSSALVVFQSAEV